MFKVLSTTLLLTFVATFAHADISETAASVFKIDDKTNYASNLKLREARRFGVGISAGGNLGLAGVNLDLNIEDADGALAGIGGGPGYSSFELLWKHNFEGDYIAPYTTLGYSRWYNSSGDVQGVRDSSVLSRVLSDDDKRTGRFATNFLTGSVGLQYTQLSGEAAGASFFAELTLLEDIDKTILVPTGAIGAMYYF